MHDNRDVFALTDAQVDEMEKIALAAGWGRAIGAGVGALGGAGIGYATGKTPEDRASRALKGAVVGGVGGVLPGQFLTAQGRRQASRFGQRQLLGLTGAVKHEGKWTRVGKLTPEQRVRAHDELKWVLPRNAEGKVVRHAEDTPTAVRELSDRLQKERGKAQPIFGSKTLRQRFDESSLGRRWEDSDVRKSLLKRRIASEKAQLGQVEKGETTLGGLAKGYLTNPLQTGKRALVAPGLALGVGVPAAFAAPSMAEAVRERDPRLAARTLAETAGYSLTGGLPLVASMGTGTGVQMLAGKLLGGSNLSEGAPQATAGRVVQQGELPRIRRYAR